MVLRTSVAREGACALSKYRVRPSLPVTSRRRSALSSRNSNHIPTSYCDGTASQPVCLKGFTLTELEEWCASLGEKHSRALQIWRFLYQDGFWIRNFHDAAQVPNGFGKTFMQVAPDAASCGGDLHLHSVYAATDGTVKMLSATDDADNAQVETVLIPVIRKQVCFRRVWSPGQCVTITTVVMGREHTRMVSCCLFPRDETRLFILHACCIIARWSSFAASIQAYCIALHN
jgi:hypothetical protein